jgi:hypothetical protein
VDPNLTARYESHLWEQVFQVMGFLLVTYIPLQSAAIWAVKHPIARLAAGLPMLPMLPVIVSGMQPNTHRDGSLYGILLMMVFAPSMIYLTIFLFSGLAIRAAKTNSPDSIAKLESKDIGQHADIIVAGSEKNE